MDTLFTTEQVATRYGTNTDTVRSWVKAKLLDAIDVSRPGSKRPKYRFSPNALEQFEKRRTAETDEESSPKPKRRRSRKQKRWV